MYSPSAFWSRVFVRGESRTRIVLVEGCITSYSWPLYGWVSIRNPFLFTAVVGVVPILPLVGYATTALLSSTDYESSCVWKQYLFPFPALLSLTLNLPFSISRLPPLSFFFCSSHFFVPSPSPPSVLRYTPSSAYAPSNDLMLHV